MSSLRICHVIHDTTAGGTETMLFKVLRQLAGQHEMHVVSLMGCGEVGRRIHDLGIPVHCMDFAQGRVPRPDRFVNLIRQLNQIEPQVVQTWAYHADLVGGLAARMSTRARVVWNIRHATLDPVLDSKNVLRSAKLCGRLSRWIPDRILLNAESAREVHAQAGYDHTKMLVLPNGFDTDRFRPNQIQRAELRGELQLDAAVPLIGMCGRFHPHKGQAEFVDVARRLSTSLPDIHFLVAGTQCDAANAELSEWIGDAGLQDRFHLLGSRSDIPAVLNALDICLLPSRTEGMPNIVGEAMACGTNVVAMDVGDTGRLLGETGVVVPAGDVATMAKAVVTILNQPVAQQVAMGEKARQRIIDYFDIDKIASQYDSIWREVAVSRTRPRGIRFDPARKVLLQPSSGQRRSGFWFLGSCLGTHWIAGSACSGRGGAPAAAHSQAEPGNEQKQSPFSREAGTGALDRLSPPKLVHVTTIPMTQFLFLRGQNRFMRQRGFEVHAVSSPGPYMQPLRERDPIVCHEIPISREIHPLADIRSVLRLWQLFRQLRPEVVQLSTPKAALLGAIAAKAAGVPIRIYQVRGLSSESETGLKRRVFQNLERLTAQLCNGHLVNARSLLKYATGAGILTSGFVAGQGMSNGVDLVRFDPAKVERADLSRWDHSSSGAAGTVIGYVGRLTRDKGLEELYRAWSVLRDEFPAAKLLLVGPWESENAVSQSCRDSLNADSRVLCAGAQQDVAPFYKAMDIFAFPSHGTEGFPNAPMEAAAMELPVIATRVVGCVDAVVDNVTGRLISPRSAEELESSLRNYLRSPELRSQHGAAGRQRIERGFTPEDLWADFLKYYTFLLRRAGLPVPQPRQDDRTVPKAA